MDLNTILKTKEERDIWIDCRYPLTIIADRYSGTYSGGLFIAFPCDYYNIPSDGPDGDDISCAKFWNSFTGFAGKGSTPDEALAVLVKCIEENISYDNLQLE